jgi:hypothetical protein
MMQNYYQIQQNMAGQNMMGTNQMVSLMGMPMPQPIKVPGMPPIP